MNKLSVLLLLAVAGPAPAGDLTFKARVYVVPPRSFAAAMAVPDSASIRTTFAPAELAVLEANLPPGARKAAAEGKTDLQKDLKLSDVKKKDFVASVDLQVDSTGVKGEPVVSALNWGLQATVKPVAVHVDGWVLAEVLIEATLPFPAPFLVEFGQKVELLRVATQRFTAKVRIPLGGAVLFGAGVVGSTGDLVVVVLEASTGRRLEELLKEQGEVPPATTPHSATAVVALKGGLDLTAAKARAAAEFLSFGASTPEQALRVNAAWRETYLEERKADTLAGRTLWLATTSQVDASVSWSASAEGGGAGERRFHVQVDVEWLKGFRPVAAKDKSTKDRVEPEFVKGGAADEATVTEKEAEKALPLKILDGGKAVPLSALVALRR